MWVWLILETHNGKGVLYLNRNDIIYALYHIYDSKIDVPDDMSIEEAIAYAKSHLDEVPLGELHYVQDSDELDEDNCDFDE